MISHKLYETGDRDCPEAILDRNGEVVLGLCRRCRKAEAELYEDCISPEEDLQEALSIAYATQCRLAVLASGRWAIWLEGESPPVIVDNFEPEQMKKLILGAQELREQQREVAATPLSIEELGL